MSQQSKKYTFIIDVDNTIMTTPKIVGTYDYKNSKPIQDMIDKINGLYDQGNKIVLFTSRGMRTFNGVVSSIEKYHRPILEKVLKSFNLNYHELIFGKPWGENPIYVDDRSISISNFINKNSDYEKFLNI